MNFAPIIRTAGIVIAAVIVMIMFKSEKNKKDKE